jgi:hypothetical protein
MPKKENKTPEKITSKKICSTDTEFEELFLPGAHEKRKMQEAIREPQKLKDHILKRMQK